jgi:hypothetical protein
MGAQLLVPALQALFDLERQLLETHPEVRFYEFQPVARPKEPCIWNWIEPEGSESSWMGTGPTHEDTLVVRATIAVPGSADEQALVWKLLEYADTFLTVIDPGLFWGITPQPLGGCAHDAKRTGMHTGLHSFGPNVPPLLGMDFPIEIQLRRNDFG